MTLRVALSHASGPVAEAILERMSESGFAPDSLFLLDTELQAGRRVAFGDVHLVVADQQQADLSQYSLLLLTENDPPLAAAAEQQGCLVASHAIDDDDPPLFLSAAGVDPELSYSASRLRLVGPEVSCLLPALLAIERLQGLASAHLTLLRSAEFHGSAGIEELASQTVNLLNSRPVEARVFPQQIAFNLLTRAADARMVTDIAGFLANRACVITVQTVDVPAFHGFVAGLRLQLESGVALESVQRALSSLDGVQLSAADSGSSFDCNQSPGCAISHLQQASDNPSILHFWMTANPLRYGLANNYVNVVDFLLKSFL